MINSVIFDLDGVISDTPKIHAELETEVLRQKGINITGEELMRRFSGVRPVEVLATLLKENNVIADPEEMILQKRAKLMKRINEDVQPVPGAIELIRELHKNKLKMAVASGSDKEFVDVVLKKLKIDYYFDAVVSADEVKNGKPAPDVFLEAAKRINAKPSECVVIEDGMVGMIAAKNAKMKCIALVDENDNRRFDVDLIVNSLKDLDVERIFML